MHNGVNQEKGGSRRSLVSIVIVLFVATVFIYAAVQSGTQQNNDAQESVPVDGASTDALANVALPELGPEKPEVDSSSKEIINDVLLSNVPKADYSYSFNGKLNDAVVVTRAGDEGRFNSGTYPEPSEDVFPLFTEGVEGDALYLDGSYGVALQDVEPLNESYTISFWFRADELFDWSPFLVIGSHLMDVGGSQSYLSINRKTTEEGEQVVPIFNTIDAILNNSCEIRPSMEQKRWINLNEWAYITVCVDASASSGAAEGRAMGYLYMNSELIGSGEVSLLHMDGESVCAYLGISCYDELFRASYDEVHIWKYVLDESQISSMYTAYISA
ncbi:MAG: LamG domain-containing protein [Lachnospiraceae bacterium]|nr:LamG domain-containing protein [Lachnospiraceae bacterium]